MFVPMAPPVKEGDVLAGKFRVERVLGIGGMGVVVAAFHMQLEQRVALKFLLPEAAKDEAVVQRFAREARAAAKIQSEHVARVLDVGTLETGAPYMVMEYLEGRDLDQVLRAGGPLLVADAVSYVLQACEAVAEAHAFGIVHRDLKPANLFLAERANGSKSVKVLDFGISKVLPGALAGDPSLTKTKAVMGSPMYMSPEQLRSSRDVDVRADIWAFGVILYELLSGRGPFASGTVPEIMAAILKDAPSPLREVRTDLPDGIETVVARCLEKEMENRYANVAELAVALLSFGPPGSEVSIERVSNVLRRSTSARVGQLPPRDAADASATRREIPTGANTPPARSTQRGVAPHGAPQAGTTDLHARELAATKASRPNVLVPDAAAVSAVDVSRPTVPFQDPAAGSSPTSIAAQGLPREGSATASAVSRSSWNAERPAKRGRGAIIAVLVLALAGAGAGAFFVYQQQQRGGSAATASPTHAAPAAIAPTTPATPASPAEPTGAAPAATPEATASATSAAEEPPTEPPAETSPKASPPAPRPWPRNAPAPRRAPWPPKRRGAASAAPVVEEPSAAPPATAAPTAKPVESAVPTTTPSSSAKSGSPKGRPGSAPRPRPTPDDG
jgi:eukaryotic-like serine/threonine-protein kinase